MKSEETNKKLHSAAAVGNTTDIPSTDAGLNNQKGGEAYGSIYQCPVKCEGSKTYDQPLNCPVCEIKLVLVGGEGPEIS